MIRRYKSVSTHTEMANRTNKQNRTFSRTCSVCSSSAPHRTELNNTLVQFVFGRISNIDTRVRFCSTQTRTEQYPCSVRVRQVRTTQSKVEHCIPWRRNCGLLE